MEKILQDSKFQKKLANIAQQKGDSIEQANAEAAIYLKELFTAHQPFANLMAVQGAQYILSRGYNRTIDVNPTEIKQLAKLVRRHPVAFVMTHKTYIDMLVLGVVLARHGLPLPYTFAGINMDFLGLGQFGRQSGAIFIRRSFKDNLIYKATLRHFIAWLLDERAHFMWAIEGTRSRTGKLVWPKMGILKYIREAEEDARHEVKYVPVSIVYDLIPDVKEMAREMRGKAKSPESLGWFLEYIQKLGGKFGQISIRFGEPVKADGNHTVPIPTNGKAPYTKDTLPRFAFELVHRINQITPITTTSFICVALLSKFALTKRALESDLVDLMQLIESHKSDALVDRGKPIGESVQAAINLLSQANLLTLKGEHVSLKYTIVPENYLQATYYANMAVHHLYHRAFIELALLKITNTSKKDRMLAFWSEIMELRDLFKFEFFYSNKAQFTDEIEANLVYLDKNWEQIIENKRTNILGLLESQKVLISPVVLATYIEAYRVVAYGLQNWDASKTFTEENFLKSCMLLGEEMHWQGRIQRIESVSKPFLLNGIRLAKNNQLIPNTSNFSKENLQQFIEQLDEVAARLNTLQGITLAKPAEIFPTVPISRTIVPGSKTERITEEIVHGEMGAHIGAFFDLDRTLIKGFSAKEFFQSRLLSGKITAKELVAQFAGVLVYATGDGNFAGLAAIGAKGIKGIDEQVFIEMGEEVYLKHLAEAIYPESRALVEAHIAKGHTVAIISAATPYQVDPIARDLSIQHVMCTRMEVKKGKFTGNIIEPACWGEGKAHAARKLTKQFDLDLSKSYFYTDSAEDLPLLEIVGNPRPLNPDTKLSALAFENGWPVYRFNDDQRYNLSNIFRTTLALGSLIPAVLSGITSGTLTMSWREGVNSMMASVGDLVTKMAGIRLVIKGEENLWLRRPAVFILNHQSSVDMFIAAKLIRKDAVGIAKKELQNMPIIGQLMMASGVIFLDRKNRDKAIEALKPAVDALKNGTSIIIFPEGTRSYNYTLGQFKKGGFHLAMQANVPLIPIVIRNAHDAMPRGSSVFQPTAIEVKVLAPISTADWDVADLDENIAWVRGLFLKELGQQAEKVIV